ncbi:MAG: LuxR C-terminal-related transcriptional regulator [Chloroflexota bacterium]
MADMHSAPIRVVIADDHALLRHGARALLAEAGGFEVVGEAGDGHQAVQLALSLRPDVVLMDVDMPGPGALVAIRQIKGATCPSRVLPLGTRADEASLLSYLAAGASGLLLKEAAGAELICALREVQRVGFYVSPAASRQVLDRWHRAAARPRAVRPVGIGEDALSQRERELLECVAAGLANRHIAARLCISVKTVEAHKAHIVNKLGLRGSNDLMRIALQRCRTAPTAA